MPARRVVIVQWKDRKENVFEIFSNLKILCSSYPAYNYNTLNNYLSKRKVAFENENVRIERKVIHNRPLSRRKMAMVVNRFNMKEHDDEKADLAYWLSRPVSERLSAVTMLSGQFKKPGQRMDRTHVVRRKRKI
jgi:hypothetical protein